MKYLTFICALFLGLTACSKNDTEAPTIDPPPMDTVTHIIELGKTSVLSNGAPWNGTFSASYVPNDKRQFSIRGEVQLNGFDHGLLIRDISSKVGLQVVERSYYWNASNGIPQVVYLVSLDEDQLLNSYRVDTTRSNQFVEILRYDSINHIVEGRFQTFLEGPTTYTFLPDSIAMTEGKFHLKIKL
jgi:hypothetical protein